MKRVFIVHRWGGNSEEPLYQWLADQCIYKGFEVHALTMPRPDEPTIEDWVEHLSHEVKALDKDTYFIGHSIGCQTILRYLETQKTQCGGALFIAGWFTLQGLETKEEEMIAQPWLETQIDLEKVRDNLPQSVAVFSDNDPFVPLSDKEIFRVKLDSHILVEHTKGHFTEDDNVTKLPSALNAFLKLARL